MATLKFTLRTALLSIAMLATSFGCLRMVLTRRGIETSAEWILLLALWLIGGACFGVGIGVVIKKEYSGAIVGAIGAAILLCILRWGVSYFIGEAGR